MSTAEWQAPATAEAYETVAATAASPAVLITCEHASNRLPPGWSWPASDAHLAAQHWGYDLGIAPFAHHLARALGAPAVLSRFTRLLVDPNRPLGHETLFRDRADGQPIALNVGLTPQDAQRRIEGYYTPYHDAVDAMVRAFPGVPVLSLHSYTDLYEGAPRAVQLGVLYDADEAYGRAWWAQLRHVPLDVRINEPWSGLEGLMYSAQLHATRHGRRAVELEIRQDLLADADATAMLVAAVAQAARATR